VQSLQMIAQRLIDLEDALLGVDLFQTHCAVPAILPEHSIDGVRSKLASLRCFKTSCSLLCNIDMFVHGRNGLTLQLLLRHWKGSVITLSCPHLQDQCRINLQGRAARGRAGGAAGGAGASAAGCADRHGAAGDLAPAAV
jgi:hypothetical protein